MRCYILDAVDSEERNLRVAKVNRKSRNLRTAARMAIYHGNEKEYRRLYNKHKRAKYIVKAFSPNDAQRQGVSKKTFRAGSQAMRESVFFESKKKPASRHSHPHAYDWHDGHTDHHEGLTEKDSHPHAYDNPQVAKQGSSNVYHDIASHWGHVKPGKHSNLKHYPLKHHHAEAVDKQVKDHGYTHYYSGGKHGKPDLKNKNYNTKHLMVYNPKDKAGSFHHHKYTDMWRKTHELAHAKTYGRINKKYGEGRRLGKLGVRTPHEMKRSVEWEWHAAHTQRKLHAKQGVHVSDKHFHKELNTVMHDAVHRAVTGKFTEPSHEGFHPHHHKVPLRKAMKMIDHHAKKAGLRHDHDTHAKQRADQEGKEEVFAGISSWHGSPISRRYSSSRSSSGGGGDDEGKAWRKGKRAKYDKSATRAGRIQSLRRAGARSTSTGKSLAKAGDHRAAMAKFGKGAKAFRVSSKFSGRFAAKHGGLGSKQWRDRTATMRGPDRKDVGDWQRKSKDYKLHRSPQDFSRSEWKHYTKLSAAVRKERSQRLKKAKKNEAKLGRTWQHVHGGKEYAVFSAHRATNTKKQNKKAHRKLSKDVRKLGYGHQNVSGVGQEKGQPPTKEKSVFVPGMKKHHVRKLAKKHKQDYYIHGKKGGANLHATTSKKKKGSARAEVKWKKTKPKSAQYHTKVGKKAMHFENYYIIPYFAEAYNRPGRMKAVFKAADREQRKGRGYDNPSKRYTKAAISVSKRTRGGRGWGTIPMHGAHAKPEAPRSMASKKARLAYIKRYGRSATTLGWRKFKRPLP